MNKETGAIIVTHFPSIANVQLLLEVVVPACAYCVIVDNTPGANTQLSRLGKDFPALVILAQKTNLGIARAQNIGVQYLFSRCKYFVFFDQDSLPVKNIISHLYNGFTYLLRNGYQAGAVGPLVINKSTGKPYSKPAGSKNYIEDKVREVPVLTSSGTFFSRESWAMIGPMEEALFIDGVDLEWCWRGKYFNRLRFFMLEDISITHEVGTHKSFAGMFSIKAPTPERCYYLYRNYFSLAGRSYVPLYWKLSSGCKYVVKFFLFPLVLKPAKKYMQQMLRGLRDGIKLVFTKGKRVKSLEVTGNS